MSAMHTYPVLNISETFIRQTVYDALPESVRATMTFEEFRSQMTPDDYRYFASVLSDLINDYVVEHELFADFTEQAVHETVAQSEKLSKLYMAREIEDHEAPKYKKRGE